MKANDPRYDINGPLPLATLHFREKTKKLYILYREKKLDKVPQPLPLDRIQQFLLSRIRSIQRESIVIVKKFELEILTNFHVLHLPESEKHNFGIMSVCEHDNSKTIRATRMKFEDDISRAVLIIPGDMLCLAVDNVVYHQDRPLTSNNPTGKSRMGLDLARMDMENAVNRMQCVVYENGGHIERNLCPRRLLGVWRRPVLRRGVSCFDTAGHQFYNVRGHLLFCHLRAIEAEAEDQPACDDRHGNSCESHVLRISAVGTLVGLWALGSRGGNEISVPVFICYHNNIARVPVLCLVCFLAKEHKRTLAEFGENSFIIQLFASNRI
ncbi:hypothetical protein AVEN_225118-1 [Araneus ventricosus]|uniref:Uncharacterized protein n=1 Tax=Araneus ventricosus TaxID=182803 RepID=A0A4Y2QTL6_ARAVE|nr:hypothetical protein AVEN_225118-1 [Araneus ventricosus]